MSLEDFRAFHAYIYKAFSPSTRHAEQLHIITFTLEYDVPHARLFTATKSSHPDHFPPFSVV